MDFICTGDASEQIPEEVYTNTGINLPGAHSDKRSMATLAGELRLWKATRNGKLTPKVLIISEI